MQRNTACHFLACLGILVWAASPRAQNSAQIPEEQFLKSGGLASDDASLLKLFEAGAGAQPDQLAAAARLLAKRGTVGAARALFDFVSGVKDDWAQEEILASIGQLTVTPVAIDPLLVSALKDKEASRRATAVYVLGRRGGMEERVSVRSFFADSDKLVRERAGQALVGKRPFSYYQDSVVGDQNLLKNLGLGTDQAALLEILRQRTLTEKDAVRLQGLVGDLGDPVFAVRARASRQLIKEGTPALAFLRPALASGNPEVVRRATLAIEEIQRGPGPALPIAAIRLLASSPELDAGRATATAIRTLLDYAPFAEDEIVENEVATALTMLSVREVPIEPLLPAALRDAQPARRAVAAQVLARVGTTEHLAGLRALLDDPVPAVRLRAAQGLLYAKDRTALPTLIALLSTGPAEGVWQVEETLQRLARQSAPVETIGDGSLPRRHAAAGAWQKWLGVHGPKVDLASLSEGDTYQGFISVAEYDTAPGQTGAQAWEIGRDGKQRWKITGLEGAMDAQVLPNGHVLVAEHTASRVTERDLSGAIKWEFRTTGNPVTCQRLPNGNTFIATYSQVLEVTPDLRAVYTKTPGPQFYLFSAHKMRDGHVIAMTAQGNILRFDPTSNKAVESLDVGGNVGWCSAEALPNGRFLVATMQSGQVRELDATGKVYWTVTMPGAFRATRLPNGHTLVASMTTRIVAEFDRNGNVCWEKTCEGRPWSLRYR